MATLVAGIGTSHSPMLSMDPGAWAARAGANDQSNPGLVGVDGLVSNYEDLLARTDVTRIAKEITPDKMQAHHERNRAGIAWVAEQVYAQKLDLLVMIGDDQQEYLRDDNMPSFCVYWGDTSTKILLVVSTTVSHCPGEGHFCTRSRSSK